MLKIIIQIYFVGFLLVLSDSAKRGKVKTANFSLISNTTSTVLTTSTKTTESSTLKLEHPVACALWTRYNNDSAPSINGFSAGISAISNTTVYVGMGMYENKRLPARIQITSSNVGTNPKTSGGYIPWGIEVQVPFVEYLVVPDGCTCQWISPSVASSHNLIYTGDLTHQYAVGRKTFENRRVSLTKVETKENSPKFMTQCYNPISNTEECDEKATELLVCETTTVLTNGLPKITLTTESCGMWSSIGMQHSTANAFSAGLSIAKNTAYIGRGQKGIFFKGGRFQIKAPSGTYVSDDGKDSIIDNGSQWLIVPQNCTCSWMNVDQARIRKGLVTVPDQKYNYMIGRKLFSNGLVSISHVNNVEGSGYALTWEWYIDSANVEKEGYATEVLVCENMPAPLNGCALWTRYNGDDAPSVNGFSAGASITSNTTAYIGMGMFNQDRLPARIQITASTFENITTTSGGYVSWGSENKVIYSEYLVIPDGCTCSWMTPIIASNRAIILTGDPSVGFAVGRKTFAIGRVAISKIVTFAKHPDYMTECYNPTPSTEICREPATELLVCETAASTAAPPNVKFLTDSCAMWSTIGMVDSVSTNGFSAGSTLSNFATYTAYIGRGQQNESFFPGRYQNISTVGTYVTITGNEKLVDYGSQWLIVPQNCTCSWIHPDKALLRNSLVTVPDEIYNFMIGRKSFLNKKVAISRVNNARNNETFISQWYTSVINNLQTHDIATEILICETVKPTAQKLNACALWTRYNNDSAPSVNGLSFGISITTNTTAYVGMGMLNTDRLPARIQITTSTIGNITTTSGGYVSWASENKVIHSEYLVVPEGCTCSWMAPAIASSHAIIFTNDPHHGFAVGRKTFADGRVAISKVPTFAIYPDYMTHCYAPTPTTEICKEPATELLVCETTESTAGPPKIKFATEACGVWSTIGMVDSVATNGFSAGLRCTGGGKAYVGRGQTAKFFYVPGRYQDTDVVGTYVTFNSSSEEIVDHGTSQWLIVPQNCTCRWVAPDKGRALDSLITTPDHVYNFMIGRKTFSTGRVSISRVNNAHYEDTFITQWYPNVSFTEVKDEATEVLICETLSEPLNGCALWTRYNNDDAPSINGFAAGISVVSNTTLYVGMGMFGDWRHPARIQITNSTFGNTTLKVGAYVPSINEFYAPYSEYLVVPDGCTCSWMPPSIAANRAIIQTGNLSHGIVMGRRIFEDGRVAIAKVFSSAQFWTYMYQRANPTPTAELLSEKATELLVCETTATTAAPPKVKLPTESCGMWSTIGMNDSVATNGFSAGLSIANTTAFIGRGLYKNFYLPGRYQNNKVYVLINETEEIIKFGPQWLIVPEACYCKWVTLDQGKARNALVTAPDQYYNFMIGRKTFSNGTVSIVPINYLSSSDPLTKKFKSNDENTEIKDNATEILICETFSAPSHACALWTRYNGDNSPSVNGFSAGTSIISNTTAYVGMGMYGRWRQPARIQLTDSSGGYTIWSKEIKVNYAEYLVAPDGCKCSWMAPSIASTRAIILTGDPEVGFAVGRKKFADGRVAISKVITFASNSDFMLQWYNPTQDTEVTNEPATEILVCETNVSTTGRPKVTFASESCGMWSTIGMISSTASNGFAVGLSLANTTAYVGRGQKNNRYIAGRYQIEIPTGTYASLDGPERLVDYGSQWLIVPQNCTCNWIAPDSAKDSKSLITIPDYLHNYMIGRKNLSNGLVSISRVNFKNSNEQLYKQWYVDSNKVEASDTATEVLICEISS